MCEVLPSCVHSLPQMLAQQVLQLKNNIFFFLLSLYHLKKNKHECIFIMTYVRIPETTEQCFLFIKCDKKKIVRR